MEFPRRGYMTGVVEGIPVYKLVWDLPWLFIRRSLSGRDVGENEIRDATNAALNRQYWLLPERYWISLFG